MAKAADGPPRSDRLDRRKARTRQALVDAAVRLIAEGRGERASIQEITEAADIGFGSFYNHFDSKEELFQTAVGRGARTLGADDRRRLRRPHDPAEVFALARGSPAGSAGPTPKSPASSPAPVSTSSTPPGLHPAPCATSEPVRPPAASPSPTPRSRSAPSPADCSASSTTPANPERVDRDLGRRARRGRAAPLGVPAAQAARLVALPLPGTGTW